MDRRRFLLTSLADTLAAPARSCDSASGPAPRGKPGAFGGASWAVWAGASEQATSLLTVPWSLV